MTVRQTTMEAYWSSEKLRLTQAGRCLGYLQSMMVPQTRLQVSAGTGIDRGLTYSRVGKLISEGLVVETPGTAPCPISGRNVTWVRAA